MLMTLVKSNCWKIFETSPRGFLDEDRLVGRIVDFDFDFVELVEEEVENPMILVVVVDTVEFFPSSLLKLETFSNSPMKIHRSLAHPIWSASTPSVLSCFSPKDLS